MKYTPKFLIKKKQEGGTFSSIYEKDIENAALENGIPPLIFRTLLYEESKLKHDAKSHKGAVGLSQITQGTAKLYGLDYNKLKNDMRYNLNAGAKILSDKYNDKRVKRNWKDAIGYYNAGNKWFNSGKRPGVLKESPNYFKNIFDAIDKWNRLTEDEVPAQYIPSADKTFVKYQKGGQLKTPSSFIEFAKTFNQKEDQKENPQNYIGLKDPNFVPQSGAIEKDYTPEMIIGTFGLPTTPVVKGLGKTANIIIDALNPLSGIKKHFSKPILAKEVIEGNKNFVEHIEHFAKHFDKTINPIYRIKINKALEEGNKWSKEWYNHPITQKKFNQLKQDDPTLKPSIDKILENISNKKYTSRFVNPTEKIYTFITKKPRRLKDFDGMSGPNIFNPKQRTNYVEKYFEKNWFYDKADPTKRVEAAAVHEGSHGILDGHKNDKFIWDFLDDKFTTKNLERLGITVNKYSYLVEPTEIYARTQEIRNFFKIKPGEIVDEKLAEYIMKKGKEVQTPIDWSFFYIFKDSKALAELLNKLPIATGVGIGLNETINNKQ